MADLCVIGLHSAQTSKPYVNLTFNISSIQTCKTGGHPCNNNSPHEIKYYLAGVISISGIFQDRPILLSEQVGGFK